MPHKDMERQPLLSGNIYPSYPSREEDEQEQQEEQKVAFSDDDPEDPRQWSLTWKYIQTLQIFFLAFVCPAASAIVAPALNDIADDFGTDSKTVLGAQAGFVCMLGIGPLFLAPMSETFGRRVIFLSNLAIFTLLQIPTALAPNVASFIVLRTLSGFFGSVGVANGGGSISDLFETRERAPVLGFYLVAPLLGPTFGPLIGALVLGSLHWRWIFWVTMIMSGTITVVCYFYLYETQAVAILQRRKAKLQKQHPDIKYQVEGASDKGIPAKIVQNSTRAVRILTTQPIVLTMSFYQALVFASMYSLYSEYTKIWSAAPYNFNIVQVGLAYLGPAIGFIITAVITVFSIDRVYERLSKRNSNDGRPEYRLPLANLGAVFLPVSLFWFGWTVQNKNPWPVPLSATLLFGASQVSIFNTVQTYYIDAFEANAASALAAGAFLRSTFGGIVPLFVDVLFEKLGYGWGMSVFGFLALVLMPAPVLFYRYGRYLREKFPFEG